MTYNLLLCLYLAAMVTHICADATSLREDITHLPKSKELSTLDPTTYWSSENDSIIETTQTVISLNNLFVSDDHLAMAKAILLYINYVILPFALLVTVVNIVVFLHKSMRSSTGHYVVGLSLAQVGYLVTDVGFHILTAVLTKPQSEYIYYFYGMYMISFCLSVLRSGSYLVMCLVSAERMYAIWRPLHVKTFLLTRFPTTCTIAAYVLTAIFHFHIYVKMEIVKISDKYGGFRYTFAPTAFYMNNFNFIEDFSAGVKVVFSYSTLGILVSINVLTLVILQRHGKKRLLLKRSSDRDKGLKRERQMTVTIMGATVSYVILSLPLAAHSIAISLNPSYSSQGKRTPLSNLYELISSFTYQCMLLSCFSDFLSFLLLSSAYRRTLVFIFLLRQRKTTAVEKTAADSVSAI